LQLTNNTGVTLSTFTLSYTGEQWRGTTSTVQNVLSFAYSTGATQVYDASSTTVDSIWTNVSTLDFAAPVYGGAVTADGALNGNDAANQASINGTVSIAGGWAPGTSLWIRWRDVDNSGSDQGLALDNLSFSAAAHVAAHNGTTLTVGGSKTAAQVDLGRVVAGFATNGATVNLSSAGGATTYQDVSTDGSVVTPANGPVAGSGTTPVTVQIGGAAMPSTAIGSDVTTQAKILNTGEDNDAQVTVPLKAHVVGNRFVDNWDPNQFAGGSAAPVDFGKVLVGTPVTVSGVQLTTTNTNTGDYSSNALTTVQLPGGTVTGFAGGATSGFATVTLEAGTNGDVTFDDGGDLDTRDVTLTPIQSGVVVSGTTLGGQRSTGFLSIPVVILDTAAGASVDARVYVKGDFYAPALVTGDETAVGPGGTVTLTNNLPPSSDSTAGQRIGAEVTGVSVDQSGWSVSGIGTGTTLGGTRAQYVQSGTTFAPVITTTTGTISFNAAGKINGDYGATLSVGLQNDQTAGVAGVAANDLPATTVPLAATVSTNPAVQSGSYSLNGGTLSAPATTLTGTFTQTGGASTFASLMGDGSVRVQGGALTLAAGATANVVGSLSVSGTGKVDLTTAKLVINYSGATPSNALRLALLSGSAGGWTGATGITSSDAAAHAAQNYAIGYAEASKVLGAAGGTWNGASVDGTALLIKETYFGDANLDGRVNADDLALLDRGFAKHLSAGSARWTDGDFNYDGSVTSADYMLADTSYALHGGVLSAEFLATRDAQFGGAYVSGLLAAVPEPTSLGLVGVAAAGMLGGRRRRSSGK
jgi:hypothetical protein